MDDASKKQQDALAVAQNGGMSGNSDDGDMDDTDESLDDDMMDKISSSPSIEDGGCSSIMIPHAWPRRVDSLQAMRDRNLPVSPFSETRSSSPYTETPEYPPVQHSYQHSKASAPTCHHHLHGEYPE